MAENQGTDPIAEMRAMMTQMMLEVTSLKAQVNEQVVSQGAQFQAQIGQLKTTVDALAGNFKNQDQVAAGPTNQVLNSGGLNDPILQGENSQTHIVNPGIATSITSQTVDPTFTIHTNPNPTVQTSPIATFNPITNQPVIIDPLVYHPQTNQLINRPVHIANNTHTSPPLNQTIHPTTHVPSPPNPNTQVHPLEDPYQAQFEKLKATVDKFLVKENSPISDILSFEKAMVLPGGFKMPILEKFDGTGCPDTHLSSYATAMKAEGANEELAAQFFQLSLSGAALRWFQQQDYAHMKNWGYLCKEFRTQYEYNKSVEVTRRELEVTRQGSNESFINFVARWRKQAAQMTQRPPEEDQVQIVVRNLLPSLHQHLFAHYLPTFKALIAAGSQVEDAVVHGRIKSEEFNRSRSSNFKRPEVGSIDVQELFNVNSAPFQGRNRKFDDLRVPLGKLFLKLQEKGLLMPLKPRPPPIKPPPNYNASQHCIFHQGPGHHVDRCQALRHAIQDLIDSGRMPKPPPNFQPNIVHNPLPNHDENHINVLTLEDKSVIDPVLLITPSPSTLAISGNPIHLIAQTGGNALIQPGENESFHTSNGTSGRNDPEGLQGPDNGDRAHLIMSGPMKKVQDKLHEESELSTLSFESTMKSPPSDLGEAHPINQSYGLERASSTYYAEVVAAFIRQNEEA